MSREEQVRKLASLIKERNAGSANDPQIDQAADALLELFPDLSEKLKGLFSQEGSSMSVQPKR